MYGTALILPSESASRNNQELKENLEKAFGKVCIPQVKKLRQCQLKRVTTNIAITKAYSQASDVEKRTNEFRPAILCVPKSIVESGRTDKNKDKLISITCRYRSGSGDSKKNNYVI